MSLLEQTEYISDSDRFSVVKEEQQNITITELAAYIRDCWKTNRDHKEEIEAIMNQCTRQRNGEYDSEDLEKLGDIDIFINITGLKCDACEAWIKDVLVNAADQPWTIEPTPIPDIPDYLLQQIKDILKSEILARGYPSFSLDMKRLQELKKTSQKEINKKAAEACEAMTKKINDQMQECDWRKVFEQWQSDIITYPGGVIKGAIVRHRQTLKWQGNELVATQEPALVCERVSPLDLYPSPEATNPQDANNIIERMRMTKSKLYESIGLPNFNDEAIRMVINEFEDGFYDWLNFDGERYDAEKKGLPWGETETIDVLDFWGRVPGKLLAEWGLSVDDPEAQYECNAWLIGNYVVRALINPDPLGRRPYHVTSFRKLPGQFWGKGIPQLLRDIQRTANASARALIRNMSVASGPTVEIDVDRLDENEETPEAIVPWRIYYTKGSSIPGGNGQVIRYNVAPSIANELMGIMNQFMRMADDFSGVPAYSYGSQVGAMKTMGGFSLQYGNALKGIKNVLANMDRDGIEPLVKQFWTWNMLYDDDNSLKADAKIIAKGSQGILQKEQAQARSIETLQVLSPFMQSGLVPPQAARDLLVKWSRENGYDISQYFPDVDVSQEIASVMGQVPNMQAGTPAPSLDGRQGAALQAMQGEQINTPAM